jgi:hypothetical protein
VLSATPDGCRLPAEVAQLLQDNPAMPMAGADHYSPGSTEDRMRRLLPDVSIGTGTGANRTAARAAPSSSHANPPAPRVAPSSSHANPPAAKVAASRGAVDGEGVEEEDSPPLDEKELRKRDKQEKRSRGDAPVHMSCLGGE